MGWLNDAWDGITGIFSGDPPAEPVASCDGALSEAQAQALFDDMAAQMDIPFDYPPDCCYARAQRMSELMAERGIESKKAWAYGSVFEPLEPIHTDGSPVRFPPSSGPPVQWGYHVAPTVLVRGSDGVCRDMVIDPSLRDRPLTIAEWEETMGGASSRALTDSGVYYRDRNGTELGQSGVPPHFRTDAAFASHRATRDSLLGR